MRGALAYAISLVGHRADAEDIVQESYRRLLARSHEYDLSRDGRKLLFKSITNACINHAQRRKPLVSLEAAGVGDLAVASKADSRPEGAMMMAELEAAVGEALAELSVDQRAVVELASLGHPLVDVAEMLELSPANTRTLLHRARERLGERLGSFREDRS